MRLTKFVVIAAGIIALLAAIAWFLRDNLIQRLSNPLLDDYGLAIVDVSLDTLASSDASVGYLELKHEKGTTIVIEDLTLPYAAASRKSKTYRARKVSIITATRTDGAAVDIAELIQQALSLPARLTASVFVVDEFSLPPYAPVRRIRWEVSDSEQQLQASIDSVTFSATVTRADADSHKLVLSLLSAPANSVGNVLDARLHREEDRYFLEGNGTLDLPAWQPLGQLFGIVPAAIELDTGTATLAFDVAIPKDASQTPLFSALLTPASPLDLNYRDSEGGIATMRLLSDASANISATFPDTVWSLDLAEAAVTVSYGSWKKIPVSLSDIHCRTGPICSTRTRVAVENARLPVGKVALVELSSAENLHFHDEGVRIDVQPGASLNVRDLASEAAALQRFEARLVAGATLDLKDTGWRIIADSVDAEIDALSVNEAASLSMPVFLENISIEQSLDELSLVAGVFVPSSRVKYDDKAVSLPGVKGQISLNERTVIAELRSVGLHKDSAIRARHSLADGTGQLSLGEAAISFGKQKLSDRIAPLPRNLDLVAGSVRLGLAARWMAKESGVTLHGNGFLAATDLAGYLGDTAFTGLSSELRGTYEEGVGVDLEPSTVSIALVEMGVPLEKIRADYRLDAEALRADVANLSMSAFGGTITADPFSFRTASDVNTVVLSTDMLDLSELLSLEGFAALQVTGSVNARLPVAIEGDTVTIARGSLAGNAPGGVIRYKQDKPPDKADRSGISFAKRVLSNFEYTTLTSDVNLGKDGNLKLKLTLTGRNPDMEEKRPVVLNVDLENNIPQMLKSLRAARAVEDVLERRLVK